MTLCLSSECSTETAINFTLTFVSFVTLFTVYFSSMYSRGDLSTGFFYTNIWMDGYGGLYRVSLYKPAYIVYLYFSKSRDRQSNV